MLLLLVQFSSILLLWTASKSNAKALPDTIIPIIQNLTFNEYYDQPTVNFLYKVDLNSLRQYIDSRFEVVSPYNDGSAYIVLQIVNDTAYYNGGNCYHCLTFTNLQSTNIYTIVKFNNTLYRETLATSFNFTPPAIVGNLYQDPPYGSSMMYPGVQFSVNNKTGEYHFSSSSPIVLGGENIGNAAINVTLNFKGKKISDSNNQRTLVGFYLGSQNNKNEIQSAYRKNLNILTNATKIRTGYLDGILYTKIVNCTNVNIKSTYIQVTIGKIKGLDETKPVACFYIPYAHYYSVAVTPIQSQK